MLKHSNSSLSGRNGRMMTVPGEARPRKDPDPELFQNVSIRDFSHFWGKRGRVKTRKRGKGR